LASPAGDFLFLEYFTVAPTLLLQKPDDRRLEPLDRERLPYAHCSMK
jgi:hypothetical protein